MYSERMRRNLKPMVEAHGFNVSRGGFNLTSVSFRHFWNVTKGKAGITVELLEAIADETGLDMLDFFQVKVPFK